MTVDFTGDDVNTVLQTVRTIVPNGAPDSAAKQLSILATALCVAARNFDIDKQVFMACLSDTYDDALSRDLVPLDAKNEGQVRWSP